MINSLDPTSGNHAEISITSLLQPFVRRWRLLACALGLAWCGAIAITFVPARRYKATMVLAAVPNARSANPGAGISALLGTAQLGGVQPTPYFIAKLLLLRSVVTAVAMSDAQGGGLVIERVARGPLKDIKHSEIESRMRDILDASVDRQTGLITFSVTHRDSALVRQIASEIVAAASKTFIDVGRSQATEQRVAQEARVDSAEQRLRNAERDLLNFASSNRSYVAYSAAAVTRQRLERELNNAQAVYAQVAADRESVIAKELEETPAVVIVDPVPARLSPEPRRGVLKLAVASVLGFAVAAIIMVMLGDFRAERLQHGVG